MLEWFFFNWLTGGGEQSKEQVKVIQEGEIGLLRKEKYFVRKKDIREGTEIDFNSFRRFTGLERKETRTKKKREASPIPTTCKKRRHRGCH